MAESGDRPQPQVSQSGSTNIESHPSTHKQSLSGSAIQRCESPEHTVCPVAFCTIPI